VLFLWRFLFLLEGCCCCCCCCCFGDRSNQIKKLNPDLNPARLSAHPL
jgi:hypothetical protein